MTKKEIKPKFNMGDKVLCEHECSKEEGIIAETKMFEPKEYSYLVHFPRLGVCLTYNEKALRLKENYIKSKNIKQSMDDEMGFVLYPDNNAEIYKNIKKDDLLKKLYPINKEFLVKKTNKVVKCVDAEYTYGLSKGKVIQVETINEITGDRWWYFSDELEEIHPWFCENNNTLVNNNNENIDNFLTNMEEKLVNRNKIFSEIASKVKKAERSNAGKPKYSWLPMDYLEEMINGLEFGAKKYSKNGWKKGFPLSQIFDSLFRHSNKILKGEFIDEDSGLPHFGLIQCNSLFLANPNNINDIEGLETDYYRRSEDDSFKR